MQTNQTPQPVAAQDIPKETGLSQDDLIAIVRHIIEEAAHV
jgi:hypothetical protein